MNYYGSPEHMAVLQDYDDRVFSQCDFSKPFAEYIPCDDYLIRCYSAVDENESTRKRYRDQNTGLISRLYHKDEQIFEWRFFGASPRNASIIHHANGRTYLLYYEDGTVKNAMLITIFVLSILIGMICVTNAENNQPEFLQNLFHEYFPDCSYEDGYLQYDETVIFIGRKPDGTLILLCGAYEGEDGWEWVESTPLPEGTRIGDENITDAVNMNAWRGGAAVGVRRMERGRWGVYYVNSYDFYVGPDWVGMYGAETDVQFFGTHAWGDITTIDWSTLPPEEYIDRETKEKRNTRISAYVDRTNWATPAHSDPETTTELLSEAGNENTVLGRFYDGTPLFVLEQGEEWTKVKIGHGEDIGVMIGWMRTQDLVFGDDTLYVEREVIRIKSEQVLIPSVETFIGSRAGQITEEQFSSCLIIGETDQGLEIAYYLPDGDVGMIPMSNLGNGNG